jgi:hypothetical protein
VIKFLQVMQKKVRVFFSCLAIRFFALVRHPARRFGGAGWVTWRVPESHAAGVRGVHVPTAARGARPAGRAAASAAQCDRCGAARRLGAGARPRPAPIPGPGVASETQMRNMKHQTRLDDGERRSGVAQRAPAETGERRRARAAAGALPLPLLGLVRPRPSLAYPIDRHGDRTVAGDCLGANFVCVSPPGDVLVARQRALRSLSIGRRDAPLSRPLPPSPLSPSCPLFAGLHRRIRVR